MQKTLPHSDNKEKKQLKLAALIIAAVSSFLSPFMSSSINVALPDIEHSFPMDAVMLGWIATSYILAAAVFLVPFGRLADIFGRKKLFTIGTILYTISSALCALSFSVNSLILFRVLQGIGSALMFSTGMAILSSVYPPGERGKAFGIAVSSTYLGLSLGPFLGGILTKHIGWQSIFWLNIPLGILLISLIFTLLKGEWAEAKGEKFDIFGSLILSLSLIALISGMSSLPRYQGAGLIIASVIGLILFYFWQVRISYPLLDIQLFSKNRVFAFSNLAAFINYSATYAVTFVMSLFLQYVKGFDPAYTGLILVSQPIIMAVFSPLAGLLSDKMEPRIVASSGMFLVSLGLALLATIHHHSSVLIIVLYLMLLGLGFALFSSPNTNAVMSSVQKRHYGIASSVLGTMRLTGQMFSMGIAMLVFAIFIGRVKITASEHLQLGDSMRIIFIIFAVLCAVGVLASLSRGKVKHA